VLRILEALGRNRRRLKIPPGEGTTALADAGGMRRGMRGSRQISLPVVTIRAPQPEGDQPDGAAPRGSEECVAQRG
jgi:hypothetical protein